MLLSIAHQFHACTSRCESHVAQPCDKALSGISTSVSGSSPNVVYTGRREFSVPSRADGSFDLLVVRCKSYLSIFRLIFLISDFWTSLSRSPQRGNPSGGDLRLYLGSLYVCKMGHSPSQKKCHLVGTRLLPFPCRTLRFSSETQTTQKFALSRERSLRTPERCLRSSHP